MDESDVAVMMSALFDIPTDVRYVIDLLDPDEEDDEDDAGEEEES